MKKYFYIILTILFFVSCNESNSSKLDSDDYEDQAERIERLKIEIISFSDIKDAEFELFNVNGFHGQRTSLSGPGASSWDYKFVVKIDTVDISKWTAGMKEVKLKDYDDNWTKEITESRKENWQTISTPLYFERNGENVMSIVYKNEGIIYKRVINS